MSPTAPQPREPRPDRVAAKALANERLAAMRSRTHRIRMRVAGGATALFVAAFAAIYAQMASGHDPSLTKRVQLSSAATAASSSAEQQTGSAAQATGQTEESSTGNEASSEIGAAESSEASSESEASSVTTSQS